MRDLLQKLRRPLGENRRGIALIMVMMIVSSLLIIGILFTGSVTAEYRAAVYYRQAIQSEQYCIVGLHRAMAEMMYDVWGVYEHEPFVSARYATGGDFTLTDPETSLRPLSDAAYYDMGTGSLKPILRQRGFWNGEAWVVWAGASAYSGHANKINNLHASFTNVWAMDPRPYTYQEIVGGAQRYQSYGAGTSAGTVTVANGGTVVTGAATNFDPTWLDNAEIYINGTLYHIDDPATNTITATSLTIKEAHPTGEAGVSYYVVGMNDCPPSAGSPPTFPGACQTSAAFVTTTKGHGGDPRWVSAAAFIKYKPADGAAFEFGGVDIDGSGAVDATDKALRDWALWQLKRDAYLPEAMDNHDLFQAGLHANNRRLWDNGTPQDNGWEFIDPKIVGDSFYQVFRSDPLYSLDPAVSGIDDLSSDGFDDPDVAEVEAGTRRRDGLLVANDINLNPELAKSNQAGYRYPYDRTHLNKWSEVPWADDVIGGLANINGCNNDYNIEQWTNDPGSSAVPGDLTWYHYPEAKWIYCYDPLDAEKKYGRYAVSIMPDNGTWNASALKGGVIHPLTTLTKGPPNVFPLGDVRAAGGFLGALKNGFNPQTGDSRSASLLQSMACAFAPIRPDPLPYYWTNTGGLEHATGCATFWGAEGNYGLNAYNAANPGYPQVDYTRATEVPGSSSALVYGTTRGVRASILSYLMWLGPFETRSEFATYLRKACLKIPDGGWGCDYYSSPYDEDDSARRRTMEQMNVDEAAKIKVASDARLISALTTVQGFYYTLDRFWDRDLLVIDWDAADSGDATDERFATAQCERDAPILWADAAAKKSQQTRDRYIQVMLDLECFGGYRTRDGKYKLLEYLFETNADDGTEYTDYKDDHEAGTAPTATYTIAATYGGATGTEGDPSSWGIQRKTNRIEKFMAMTASRIACQQRGSNSMSAACSRGHLVHNPRISPFYKSRWDAGTSKKVFRKMRASAADVCLDDIGEGCPVCGGKLFINHVTPVSINEIGRFYGKFKNAERPVREAYDVNDPTKKPARHFVELLCAGYVDGGTLASGHCSHLSVRFDSLGWGASDSTDDYWTTYPGVLCDPVTRMPYFTHPYDFDMRWRTKPTYTTDVCPSIDPEAMWKVGGSGGSNNCADWRLLIWDADDNGGRWHDVTFNVEYGHGDLGSSSQKERPLADPTLYDESHVLITDDGDEDSANWTVANDNAVYIRADEKYVMPDPDPAHQQAAAANGFTATVSIYRKMPVRWYGPGRNPYYMDYVHVGSYNQPLGGWTGDYADDQPALQTVRRGLGFDQEHPLEADHCRGSQKYYSSDWLYKGDYDVATNDTGWPTVAERIAIGGKITAGGGCTRWTTDRTYALTSKYPRQYGVISFDERLDGSKLAIVYYYQYYSTRPGTFVYSEGSSFNDSYRIVDYVELTDSAGAAINISEACVVDPDDATKMLSWQARNPLDNRSNADGYMCWDLLPMTLQNTDHSGALDSAVGYDPWTSDAKKKWWGAGSADGYPDPAVGDAAAREAAFRALPQPCPPGYADLAGADPVCNSRNTNMWNLNVPTRRHEFDGTTSGAAVTDGSSGKSSSMSEHSVRLRTDRNFTYSYYGYREPDRKECTMSILTGIGRQVTLADAEDDPAVATYSGRQHDVLSADGRWLEGSDPAAASDNKWAAFSWDTWYDIYGVTDLCQQMLWNLFPNTLENLDFYDGDQDGIADEEELTENSLTYVWNGGTVSSVKGHFVGELKQINKLNLNELWYPPTFAGAGWTQSYTSFGRKPLKGFHSPSDSMLYHYYGSADANSRVKPWDLDNDDSSDLYTNDPDTNRLRFDSSYCSNSTVYTIFVTGNAVDQTDEPLAEMRARVTVERTWDGRMNILEFTWLPTDRGFME